MKALLDLFYPDRCCSCGRVLQKGEEELCLHCLYSMPLLSNDQLLEQRLIHRLAGRVKTEMCYALLQFRPTGMAEKILYEIKYRGNEKLAYFMGLQMGMRLALKADELPKLIVPVPLHRKRQRQRGYNQSTCLSRGIAEQLKVPLEENLLCRSRSTDSLTRMTRLQRMKALQDQYTIGASVDLSGVHLLLVDDVITSGATIETCASMLIARGALVSVATLAARM